jgi:hypothetical protein
MNEYQIKSFQLIYQKNLRSQIIGEEKKRIILQMKKAFFLWQKGDLI